MAIGFLGFLVGATWTTPKTWRQVKIGDERDAVLKLLGQPRIAGWDLKGDEWTRRTGIGSVAMRVCYRVTDERITVRSVRYIHWLGTRDFGRRLCQDEILQDPSSSGVIIGRDVSDSQSASGRAASDPYFTKDNPIAASSD